MPDVMPVCMQDILYSRKSGVRAEKIVCQQMYAAACAASVSYTYDRENIQELFPVCFS